MLKRKIVALMLVIPMLLSASCGKSKKETTEKTKKKEQTEATAKDTEEPTEKTVIPDTIKALDPFQDLKVTIGGVEGYPEVSFDTSACDEVIQNNVVYDYTTEDEFLNVGENIIVSAKFSSGEETIDVQGTKYGLSQTSMSYEAKSDELGYILGTDNLPDSFRRYVEETWYPSAQQEIIDIMMSDVQTEKGVLQISNCGNIRVGSYCFAVNITFDDGKVYKGKNGNGMPITDAYFIIGMSCKASGVIKETQEQIQDYKIEHYAILYVELPSYKINEFCTRSTEFLFSEDIDVNMKAACELENKEMMKALAKYIDDHFPEKKHLPAITNNSDISSPRFDVYPSFKDIET